MFLSLELHQKNDAEHRSKDILIANQDNDKRRLISETDAALVTKNNVKQECDFFKSQVNTMKSEVDQLKSQLNALLNDSDAFNRQLQDIVN